MLILESDKGYSIDCNCVSKESRARLKALVHVGRGFFLAFFYDIITKTGILSQNTLSLYYQINHNHNNIRQCI